MTIDEKLLQRMNCILCKKFNIVYTEKVCSRNSRETILFILLLESNGPSYATIVQIYRLLPVLSSHRGFILT